MSFRDDRDNEKNKKRQSLFSWMSRDSLGVPDDEPPIMDNPGFINYFKLLGRKLNQIVTVNLLMLACCFPVVFALLATTGYFSIPAKAQSFSIFPQLMGVLNDTHNAYTSAIIGTFGAQQTINVLSTVDYVLIALSLLVLFTFGPMMVGTTYLFRNMVREEPIFLWSDFIHAIKKNFRQAIVFGIIDLGIFVLSAYNLMFFYLNYGQSMMMAMMFFATLIIVTLYITMRMFIYPMMITFDLSIIKLLKNSLIFSVLGIKRNAIGLVTITVIALATFMLMTLYLPIGILLPFIIVFSLLGYTGTYYAYPTISKYMIEPYYNKDGSPKTVVASDENSDDEGINE